MRPEDFQTARLELEWKQFALRTMVDAGLMLEPELSIRRDGYDFLRDQMMVSLRTQILTDNLPPETITQRKVMVPQVPKSTWQMWKYRNGSRWYTRWFVGRWPVKLAEDPEFATQATCTFDLQRFRSYPEAQYRASDFRLGRAVLMHSVGSPVWDFEHLKGYGPDEPQGSGE